VLLDAICIGAVLLAYNRMKANLRDLAFNYEAAGPKDELEATSLILTPYGGDFVRIHQTLRYTSAIRSFFAHGFSQSPQWLR